MACIITYENKQYTQKEFEQYFKEHFTEFVNNFLGSKQDIEGFKKWIREIPQLIEKETKEKGRIKIVYPKEILLVENKVSSEKLLELSKLEPKNVILFVKGEPYGTTISKLYGETARDYVIETNSEFTKEEGEFFKINPKFIKDFLQDYLIDPRSEGETLENYAKKVLKENEKKVDTYQQEIQFKVPERINEKLRLDVISKFHSTKEQALTAYNQIKDLLKGSYVHQVGDKWKVYAPVQKPRSNQFPQQSIPKNKEELLIEQFKKIVDKLYKKFREKINYKIVEPEEILKYIEEKTGQTREELQLSVNNTPAVYKGNTILYPTNYLTSEVAFHEFAHPFVDAITEQKRPLFLRLKRELQDTESGKQIIKEVKKYYPWLVENNQLTEEGWKEAITTAIGKLANNQLDQSKDKGLIESLKLLLKRIGEYLSSLFSDPNKPIKPIEIDPNTTFEELAVMLHIDNPIDLSKDEYNKSNRVDYNLKSLEFLSSEKATQLFDKFFNNKEKFYKEITQFVGKDQVELIRNIVDAENPKTLGDIMTSLLANYSYTVEINTAKEKLHKKESYLGTPDFTVNNNSYSFNFINDNPIYLKNGEKISEEEYDKSFEEYKSKETNTQYYSNLTVPGGTNYTENEIRTPDITPSIKGHAQFSTDQGIGWFRSDEPAKKVNYTFEEWKTKYKEWFTNQGISSESDLKRLYNEEQNSKDFVSGNVVNEIKGSKTRRILEVQSDLFQKGRGKSDLTSQVNDKTDLGFSGIAPLEEYLDAMEYSLVEYEGKTKEEAKKIVEQERVKRTTKNSNKNQFLQLLNKDNNWVTFFVKSIIQDSAKKGYEKVLFPSGNTASKIEGHTTLEEENNTIDNRIKTLEFAKTKDHTILRDLQRQGIKIFTPNDNIDVLNQHDYQGVNKGTNLDVYSKEEGENPNYIYKALADKKYTLDDVLNKSIEYEKNRKQYLEKEGFGALKPIYNFYENTVTNILNKTYDKENVKQITDEYGNKWNEINLEDLKDKLKTIQFSIPKNKESEQEERKKERKKEREKANKSPYLKQYVYFKRRLAYLEKQQKSTKEDTPSFNILQEEINKIGEGIKKVTKDQDYGTYKKLADDTLDYVKQKIEDLVDTKERKGKPITDEEITDISDILDTFKDFKGSESIVKEYTEKLFPLIQERGTKLVQNYSTDKVTKEDINNQNEDIGKFTKGVGSLSDSKNYIGRTIGSIIKEAQNRRSTRSKQLKSRIEKQIDNLNNWGKKNGVALDKVYDLFIQPKENSTMLAQQYLSNGQLNPNFKTIVDNPELSEFYQFYQDTIFELQKNQSIKLGKNFIPNLKKTKGLWNKIKEAINVQNTSDTDFTSKESLYADVLPTKYIKKLEDSEKSRDLGAILMSYGKHVYNHEEMSDILPSIRLLQKNLQYELTPEGVLTERSFKKSSDPKTEIFGAETNLNKMIEDVINMQVFGEMKYKELKIELGNTYDKDGNITGRKYVHVSNIIDLLLRYNSLLRIGFSPITAASNIIFGDVSNFMEAIGGKFFNLTQLTQASNIFLKQTLDKESVLNKVLIEELNILQDLEDYNQVTDVSLKSIKKLSPEKVIEYAYSMQKSGEKFLQARPAIAVMLKDGYLSPKGELTDKYKDASDKEKSQLVDKIQRVNQMIHGRYTQQEAATLQQSVLYRLVSQFKKWLPTAIENRIGERKYDNRLQTETEGRYVTIGRLLVNFNDTYNRVKSGNLSELEVYNLKKTLTELTLFTAIYLSLGALKGDDEESKKLRKNWAVKTGLTLLNRVSGDISYFFDPSQIANTSKNLVPLVRTMDDLRLAISYLPSAFSEEGIYKKGSRKGQNKFLTKFASIVPGPNQFYQLKRLANKQELEEFTK